MDVYPGDRDATCHGLMKPIEVLKQGDSYILLHRCEKCAYVKKNRLSRNDNMESVIALSRELAK